MFIGSYYHKLEDKGRVSLPKSFRLKTGSEWIITPGLDGGLFLFPSDDFAQELQKMAQLEFNKANQRNYIRLIANQAQALSLDKTGRIHLPEYLIQVAHLKKDLVLVGSLTRVEIWDQGTYHQLLDDLNQNAASIAERIEWGSPTLDSQDNALPSPRRGV